MVLQWKNRFVRSSFLLAHSPFSTLLQKHTKISNKPIIICYLSFYCLTECVSYTIAASFHCVFVCIAYCLWVAYIENGAGEDRLAQWYNLGFTHSEFKRHFKLLPSYPTSLTVHSSLPQINMCIFRDAVRKFNEVVFHDDRQNR